MLYLCPKLGYCSDETAMELNKRCKSLSNAIGAFISYLENDKGQRAKDKGQETED
jgi:hypothetical protein